MTVQTSSSKVVWLGNGATTVFSYNFEIDSASHVVLTYTDASGNASTPGSTTWSISGLGNAAGGTLTYPLSGSPLAVGTTLTLQRIVPFTQPTNLTNQAGLWPTVVMGMNDNQEYQIQQLADAVSRSLVISVSESGPVLPLPPAATRASKNLTFDAAGNPIASLPVSGSAAVSSAMIPVVSSATRAAAAALLAAGGYEQTATGQFYASNGAVINRINDRLLVGPVATSQAGNTTGQQATWLGLAAGGQDGYMDTLSQMEVISSNGGVGAAFAARTSDIAVPRGDSGAFAMTAYAQNDASSGSQGAWGLYASAIRTTSHGSYTAGVESDVTTLQPYVVSSAYNSVPAGVTTAYTAAAGGESALSGSGLTVNPTSAALTIFTAGTGANTANPIAGTGALFGKGIVIQNNAIKGTDGSGGTWGVAMEMVKGHAIVWATNTGATSIGGMIRSDVVATQEANQTRLIFAPGGLHVKGVNPDLATEVSRFFVQSTAFSGGTTVANNIFVSAEIAGSPPVVSPMGTDTNIDLRLAVKGTGVIWMGVGAQTASVAGNFSATKRLQVKDGAGTTYYIPVSATAW